MYELILTLHPYGHNHWQISVEQFISVQFQYSFIL